MKEIIGNLFDYPVICITTNGVVKSNNKLVMGKGVALTAKQLYPDIDEVLGLAVQEHGNRPYWIDYPDRVIISFPTKHHWKDNSDIELIKLSTAMLVMLADINKVTNVYLPRIGCGNGNLNWSKVKTVLEDYLDDRFIVVSEYV